MTHRIVMRQHEVAEYRAGHWDRQVAEPMRDARELPGVERDRIAELPHIKEVGGPKDKERGGEPSDGQNGSVKRTRERAAATRQRDQRQRNHDQSAGKFARERQSQRDPREDRSAPPRTRQKPDPVIRRGQISRGGGDVARNPRSMTEQRRIRAEHHRRRTADRAVSQIGAEQVDVDDRDDRKHQHCRPRRVSADQ